MVKNSEAAKVMIIRMHSMKKNRREKKDWFRYHRNEKNWFAQKLRRFMHQCAFVLATPQYQITVIRLNSLLSHTEAVSRNTNERTKVARIIVLWIYSKEISDFISIFFLQYRRKFNDFFLFCGFLKWRLSIFSSHMWLWIDNLNLIWLSVWCVGKFNFLRTLVAVIFRIWKLKKNVVPVFFFFNKSSVVIMRQFFRVNLPLSILIFNEKN